MTASPPALPRAPLAAALAYAQAGWPVLPCDPRVDPPGVKRRRSKAPLVPGGLKAATADEAQIRDWWGRWPRALIAVPTGRPSGGFVVDLDPGGAAGTLAEVVSRLGQAVGPLPEGPQAETQGGGRHLWFALPDGLEIRNAQSGQLLPGIDVRGQGGYVIVPPSVMADGRAYRWIRPPLVLDPGGVALPEAPPALLDLVLRRGRFAPTRKGGSGRGGPPQDRIPPPGSERAEPRGTPRAGAGRQDFFRRANAAALASLDRWVPRLFPTARLQPGTGAWRVASADLGRPLEEDLSIHAGGIRDFGTERALTAIDLVIEHGGAPDAVEAALWLCRAIGVAPESLGWRADRRRAKAEPGKGPQDPEPADGAPRARKPQRDGLISLGLQAELFRWQGEAFATVNAGDHFETYRLRSRAFRNWLNLGHYEQTGGAAGGQAIEDAIGALEAEALTRGEERQAHLRVAEHGSEVYLDLADARWRVVQINHEGWRVVEAASAPVRFTRARGMLALPEPKPGGHLGDLAAFVNVGGSDLPLVLAWLAAAFRARGPYPVLAVSGEQGSAKSTLLRMLRALLDPSVAPIRTVPREERDLVVAATNSWVLAFDNLSTIPPWLSDALARISTGGGFGARQLHSDLDEVLVDACRPAMLNGIGDMTGRPDLADRAIAVHLRAIEPGARRTEAALWRAFEEDRPFLLGAVLDVVAAGLGRLADVELHEAPRMADFASWGVAIEEALGLAPGEFLRLYRENAAGLVQAVVEDDPVALGVRDLSEAVAKGEVDSPEPAGLGAWLGTASDLLAVLRTRLGERITNAKTFPAAPNALAARLRRAAPALRATGVLVDTVRHGKGRTRLIELARRTMDGGRSIAPMS